MLRKFLTLFVYSFVYCMVAHMQTI